MQVNSRWKSSVQIGSAFVRSISKALDLTESACVQYELTDIWSENENNTKYSN